MPDITINTKPIILCHFSDKSKSFLVDQSACEKSDVLALAKADKLIINSGTEDSLIFIIKYLNFYKDSIEPDAPEHPLAENTKLTELFEYESVIFGDLLNTTDIDKKIKFVKNLMEIASELHLTCLSDKLSAIISFYMMNICQ